MRSATRSVNEQAADGLNRSGSKCLRRDGQELQFGDLLDKLHWSLEFAVQADLALAGSAKRLQFIYFALQIHAYH